MRFHHFRATVLVIYLLACDFAAHAADYRIDTIAGTGQPGNNGPSGPALKTTIDQPFGVEIGPDGALVITEVGQHRVRRMDLKTGQLTTVAGTGKQGYSGDGGPATQAELNEPYEVRFDREGHMFFVEMQNQIIRRVDAKSGVISTVAGTGEKGYGGDGGPAREAKFSSPHSICFDERGYLYVADIGNHRVRRIDLQRGMIETILGTGEKNLPTDGGPAKGSPIFGPRALGVADGTLWIALREGNSVWKLDLKQDRIHRVAGTGKKGNTGDGGPALEATFNGPKGLVVAPNGNVFIVDTENQTIREIDPRTGRISTVAGIGPEARGFGGDGGPARQAKFDRAHGIGADAAGNLFIGDTNNHRVRKLLPAAAR